MQDTNIDYVDFSTTKYPHLSVRSLEKATFLAKADVLALSKLDESISIESSVESIMISEPNNEIYFIKISDSLQNLEFMLEGLKQEINNDVSINENKEKSTGKIDEFIAHKRRYLYSINNNINECENELQTFDKLTNQHLRKFEITINKLSRFIMMITKQIDYISILSVPFLMFLSSIFKTCLSVKNWIYQLSNNLHVKKVRNMNQITCCFLFNQNWINNMKLWMENLYIFQNRKETKYVPTKKLIKKKMISRPVKKSNGLVIIKQMKSVQNRLISQYVPLLKSVNEIKTMLNDNLKVNRQKVPKVDIKKVSKSVSTFKQVDKIIVDNKASKPLNAKQNKTLIKTKTQDLQAICKNLHRNEKNASINKRRAHYLDDFFPDKYSLIHNNYADDEETDVYNDDVVSIIVFRMCADLLSETISEIADELSKNIDEITELILFSEFYKK
ncbi:hypothetical protein A3Q56_02619 [Intoshia linei]|uniref:Uncharacterized protein n=1 Tax=Intoshia linei TaxID=1819745 RepID=A0A177B5U1_9BILA|nr:hypothetical protein A3Q56_02619 [Intoshia linei]